MKISGQTVVAAAIVTFVYALWRFDTSGISGRPSGCRGRDDSSEQCRDAAHVTQRLEQRHEALSHCEDTREAGWHHRSPIGYYEALLRERPDDDGLKVSFVYLLVMEGRFERAAAVAETISSPEAQAAALERIAEGLALHHEGKPLPGALDLESALEDFERTVEE